jgi:hypothetical protein
MYGKNGLNCHSGHVKERARKSVLAFLVAKPENHTLTFVRVPKTQGACLFGKAEVWAYGLIFNQIKHKSMLG